MRREPHSQDLTAPAAERSRRITSYVAHEVDAQYGLVHLDGATVIRAERTQSGYLIRFLRTGHTAGIKGRIDVLFIRCKKSDLTFIRGAGR